MYKAILRPILFKLDPEKAHHFTFWCLKTFCKIPFAKTILSKIFHQNNPKLERKVFGLTFKNPVGLSAGFDKNATLYNELSCLGFGFIEIGTVTPKPQKGNPKKRLFRLLDDQGIVNRMGFNNQGMVQIVKNLKQKRNIIIGGNIGKNTETSPENYTRDYCETFKELHPFVDYFVLNISCPNVGSHHKLEDKTYLIELINTIKSINKSYEKHKPILIKIAPDLTEKQLDNIIELVNITKIDGVVATNTSVNRIGLLTEKETLNTIGNGGLSGKPIREKSTATIKYLADKSNKSFPIIGVGGIHSEEDAIEKLNAGASLVQIYTGFIYEGAGLIKRINTRILKNDALSQ